MHADMKKFVTFIFAFATGTGFFVGARAMIIFVMSIRASTILHEKMIK